MQHAHAQPENLVIVSQPLPGLLQAGQDSSDVITAETLAQLPYARLDTALGAQSSFSLFRRIPSLSANPTIQGATLRGIGPNGAGRAAVLLDGAPLNDPFGNWVNWSALPIQTVNQVILERGGRPLSGGPGALSGLIAIHTGVREEGHALFVSGNTLAGFDGGLSHAGTVGKAQVIANVSGGRRDGYILRPRDQRGAADVTTASHNAAVNLKIAVPISTDWDAALQLRGFAEARDNGLVGAVNSTDGFDGNIRLTKAARDTGWSADVVLYGQVREFKNLFTSADAQRETTRPVLNQFSVPAYATGLRAHMGRQWNARSQTMLFFSLDHKSGETREAFRNLGAGFTRQRRAGGSQQLLGLGVLHRQTLTPTLLLETGLRVDATWLRDGQRIEIDTTTNTMLRTDNFDTQTDVLPGGEVSLIWQANPAWRVHGRGYTGYRMPSLNEYFRPFRVGNDITEANPELANETLLGVDIGIRFEPISGQFVGLTLFRNWINDAVGNISVAGTSGGFIAPCGFVPTGGSCRQRGNIAGIDAFGVELSAGLRLTKTLRIASFYSFTDTSIADAASAPQLLGKALPQVPRHQASISAFWQAASVPLTMSATLRGQTRQFDDDLNQRILKGFLTLDASAQWAVSDALQLRIDIVNLFDQQIEAGVSGDGLITRGQPVTATAGLSLRF